MKTDTQWHCLDSGFEKDFPEENRLLEVTTETGNVRNCRYYKNLFWTPDMEMYVYYTPVMWRYVEEEE